MHWKLTDKPTDHYSSLGKDNLSVIQEMMFSLKILGIITESEHSKAKQRLLKECGKQGLQVEEKHPCQI